jgi:hypothetical protein
VPDEQDARLAHGLGKDPWVGHGRAQVLTVRGTAGAQPRGVVGCEGAARGALVQQPDEQARLTPRLRLEPVDTTERGGVGQKLAEPVPRREQRRVAGGGEARRRETAGRRERFPVVDPRDVRAELVHGECHLRRVDQVRLDLFIQRHERTPHPVERSARSAAEVLRRRRHDRDDVCSDLAHPRDSFRLADARRLEVLRVAQGHDRHLVAALEQVPEHGPRGQCATARSRVRRAAGDDERDLHAVATRPRCAAAAASSSKIWSREMETFHCG